MRSLWSRGVSVVGVVAYGLAMAGAFAPGVRAQEKTAKDGVYTDAQAARGDGIYQDQCAACHGADLKGGGAPPLAGADFLAFWGKAPLSDLVDKITGTMPATTPGSLSPQQTADIVSYMLKVGKFPAGTVELPTDAAVLKTMVLVQ